MIRAIAKRFTSQEEGVTAIEYALIASLIALVIIAAITLVGGTLEDVFSEVGTEIQNA